MGFLRSSIKNVTKITLVALAVKYAADNGVWSLNSEEGASLFANLRSTVLPGTIVYGEECRLLLCWMSILTLPGFSGAQYGAGGAGAVTYPSTNANFGAYSIPDIIDNQVVDTPSIRCTDRGVEFSINTRNPFRGNIYVQGEFGLAECRREFYNNEAPVAGIEVRLGDCGMIREKRPHGMSYSLILITNFHPRFVTRVDRAYKIFCSYQQAERPVGVDLEVGSVPEESVSSDALMVPDCEYTMRVGDLNGPLASATVKVGELIYHRWECQRSDLYGMLVKNCRVFDGGNDNVTLLDDRGCPTHTGVIQSPPVYSDGLNMAFAPVFAFHFPDRTQMNFRCQIQSCNKLDNECQGLTPPNCQQQNYGGSYGSVQPTATGVPYPPREGYGIPPTIDSTTATFGPTVLAPGAVYQQPPPPFIGAGISPSSPPNTLPLASVLQGNPSQVLQGLQRPWGKQQQQRTATMQSAGRAAHKREQMELEQRILMATQQLRRTADGSWPPSLVIFGANKSAVGGESAIARRFFRPIPSEERELRQRQRRAEEHTQDVTATSTVINDGLHGLEWSNEDGKTRLYQQIFLTIMGYPKPSNKAQWFKACRKGNLEAVEFFVDIGQDVDVADSDGYTGLIVASLNGEADVVRFLLSEGARVDRTTTKGFSALFFAVNEAHLDVCKLLVAKGADANQRANDVFSPWLVACAKGRLDIVKFFVDIGQDVDVADSAGATGLIAASLNGKADVVRFLLSKGARVDRTTTKGYSTLSIAAFNRHLDVCKLLVAKGADVNQRAMDDLSPWLVACAKGHLDIVELFVDNGQDVEATTGNGGTGLMVASQKWEGKRCPLFAVEGRAR
uniref:ZP domain-containing protein n=1 Tax=Globodera pallida TaxID=36090 RepID=A0A183C6J9_GLOPA